MLKNSLSWEQIAVLTETYIYFLGSCRVCGTLCANNTFFYVSITEKIMDSRNRALVWYRFRNWEMLQKDINMNPIQQVPALPTHFPQSATKSHLNNPGQVDSFQQILDSEERLYLNELIKKSTISNEQKRARYPYSWTVVKILCYWMLE